MTEATEDMAPLVEIRDLRKFFETRRGPFGAEISVVRAVDGVSFSVGRGEAFGLVGESGCGKSTVGRLALRLIDPDEGEIRFEGEDITTLPKSRLRPMRRRMQMIFQDPYSSLNPKMTVGRILGEALAVHGIATGEAMRQRVGELLEEVGLPAEAAARYPHEFSGGQRQRIAIARALSVDPDFIVADEPVSALDVSIQAQVLDLMRGLLERRGLGFLFISHDLGVVRYFCRRLAVMYLGRIVETGPVPGIFDTPLHPYTQALRAASPAPDPAIARNLPRLEGETPSASAPPSGCHFHPRCPHATDLCRREYPRWTDMGDGRAVACHLHDPAAQAAMNQNAGEPRP
jgi:peptide/nickel transport system ATP-binding protein